MKDMTESRIEITDTQYLIRLNKDEFTYAKLRAFVAHLLSDYPMPLHGAGWDGEEERSCRFEHGERFDQLADK